jgi:hypothetical protein
MRDDSDAYSCSVTLSSALDSGTEASLYRDFPSLRKTEPRDLSELFEPVSSALPKIRAIELLERTAE